MKSITEIVKQTEFSDEDIVRLLAITTQRKQKFCDKPPMTEQLIRLAIMFTIGDLLNFPISVRWIVVTVGYVNPIITSPVMS